LPFSLTSGRHLLFNVNVGFISLAYPFGEGSCDGFWLKHWTMHVFRLDCLLLLSLLFLIRLSLPHANSFLRSIQSQRSVSVIPRFPRSVSVFLVSSLPLLASIILPRSRSSRLRFLSFVSSSSTSSRSRHLYNMSPIMTFLVSGLLPFVSASPFILGFLAMSPVPFMASCFSVRRRTSWLLPPSLGLKTPAKLHFLSWVYKLVVAPFWV